MRALNGGAPSVATNQHSASKEAALTADDHRINPALAHVNAQTFGGVESCTICHGAGSAFAMALVHKNR